MNPFMAQAFFPVDNVICFSIHMMEDRQCLDQAVSVARRQEIDLDFAIRLRSADAGRLMEALGMGYYASEEAARSAIERGTSFNIVQLATVLKVDLFLLGDSLLDSRELWIASQRPRSGTSFGPDVDRACLEGVTGSDL
jgi:hypothetical protein